MSDEIINRIAEQCTFEGMMKNAESFKVIDRCDRSFQILRKGAVGDWKNYFTSELNERFGREVLEKLRGSGLEFEYEIWQTDFKKVLNKYKGGNVLQMAQAS